ncbi:MAG: DUF1207 domain-containing protein [Planctomycetia bacterium]|nr:DUF1207 domain-containing protein [Planctomycetia bacterium]
MSVRALGVLAPRRVAAAAKLEVERPAPGTTTFMTRCTNHNAPRLPLAIVLALLSTIALPAAHADVQLDDLPRSMRTAGGPYVDAFASDEEPLVAGPPVVAPPPYGAPPPAAYSAPCLPPGVLAYDTPWTWQLLPEGLIWHSYLAGPKEPRLASIWAHQQNGQWDWDFTLGGRVGLLRYGTPNSFRPDGFQLDVEAAAFPRLSINNDRDLQSADFRGGFPLTYGAGPFQMKLEYYHLSSHLGDEFMIKNPTVQRINYSRDALVLGVSYFPTDNIRLYAEADYALFADGGSEPWHFQFGAEYSPIFGPGFVGSPFAAINGSLRQEVNYGGSLVVQAGWQWLSIVTGRRLRFGFQYFNGKSEQYEFFNSFEQQLAIAVWYDY